MNRSARAKFNRAVQALIDAEVAFSWLSTKAAGDQAMLLTQLLKARMHYKRLLDKHTDPVVPPTKKESKNG